MLAVDHAGRPPDYPSFARELRSQGIQADIRYLATTEGVDAQRAALNQMKVAHKWEVDAAREEGLAVILVWQQGKTDSHGGAAAGSKFGAEAQRQALALGYPAGSTIYVACADYDAPASDHDAIERYVRAFAAACSGYRIGGYGKNLVGKVMLDRGAVSSWWQSYGFSRPVGVVEPWAVMYQRREQRTFAGVTCDVNDVMGDHGGWGPMDLVTTLRLGGLQVRDERVPGRPGPVFAPVGVLLHHTVTPGPALETLKNGRPDLAGPLCNINITRTGVVNVVCDGRANHAGKGSSRVLGDVKAERPVTQDAMARGLVDDTDGNSSFVGIEVDNNGVGEPLTDSQLAAMVDVCRVLTNHFGWSPNRVIHHRQWTRRKTDMKWRGDMPTLIRGDDDLTPAQAQQLQDIHDMLDVIKNGAPSYGVEATPVATTLTHRLAIKIADKLGVPTS